MDIGQFYPLAWLGYGALLVNTMLGVAMKAFADVSVAITKHLRQSTYTEREVCLG